MDIKHLQTILLLVCFYSNTIFVAPDLDRLGRERSDLFTLITCFRPHTQLVIGLITKSIVCSFTIQVVVTTTTVFDIYSGSESIARTVVRFAVTATDRIIDPGAHVGRRKAEPFD